MARAVVVLALLAGCGRIGFGAVGAGGDDAGPGDDAPPLPVGRWQQVASSDQATCSITMTGELWCVGRGGDGQLGIGSSPELAPLTRVGTDSDWAQVSIEAHHACAVKTNGTLWCWGFNIRGEIGVGITGQGFNTPQHVSPGSFWTSVRVGSEHACAIRDDASLWCWGANLDGQLGIGNQTDQTRPTPVTSVATWKSVALGSNHTCGLRSDLSLACWGSNGLGQLGTGSVSGRMTSPTTVSAGPWEAVDLGESHTCALRDDGTVWCWGESDLGQVGPTPSSPEPTPFQVLSGATAIATGQVHSCATTSAGELRCWGMGTRGRIPGVDLLAVRAPVAVPAPAITQFAAGGASTCIVDDAAHLFCTGASSYGQHGGATGQAHEPERIGTRTDWQKVFAQSSHACGILADRSVQCWANGSSGQVGDGGMVDRQEPTRVPGIVADRIEIGAFASVSSDGVMNLVWGYDLAMNLVAATPTFLGNTSAYVGIGDEHVCRVDDDLSLDCIGNNNRGQIGDGTMTYASAEVTIAGTWEAVDVWGRNTCATDSTQRLKCWGEGMYTGTNAAGNVLTPTNVVNLGTPVTRFELGFQFGCALVGAGEVWCWGNNGLGQLGNGTQTQATAAVRVGTRSDWRVIDAGDVHVCAVTATGELWCWGHGDQGQLGIGELFGARTTPVRVGTDSDWADVACGDHFTCAVKTDGTLWCFGNDYVGQLGNGRAWVNDFVVIP